MKITGQLLFNSPVRNMSLNQLTTKVQISLAQLWSETRK